VAPPGCVVNASFEAAPAEMVNGRLVAEVSPPLAAISVFDPAESTERLENVAIPDDVVVVRLPVQVARTGFRHDDDNAVERKIVAECILHLHRDSRRDERPGRGVHRPCTKNQLARSQGIDRECGARVGHQRSARRPYRLGSRGGDAQVSERRQAGGTGGLRPASRSGAPSL